MTLRRIAAVLVLTVSAWGLLVPANAAHAQDWRTDSTINPPGTIGVDDQGTFPSIELDMDESTFGATLDAIASLKQDLGNCPGPLNVCVAGVSGTNGQAGAINAANIAGHTGVAIAAINAGTLAACDVLFVLNQNNGGFGTWTAALPAVEDWVNAGGVGMFHDRTVTGAGAILPGAPGINCTRDTGAAGTDINVFQPVDPKVASIIDGPGGIVTDATLDGGNLSSHGYCDANTLPAGGINILTRPIATQSVLLGYPLGAGFFFYSSIPLDFYLGGAGIASFRTIYAPNAIAGAADCFCFNPGEEVISVDPNRQLGKQVHLPILNFQGQDDVCRTWIEVQYVGCDPSKAVLVTWGEPGFCPPQAAGPLKVECTGLLNPGSTWNLLGAQIPTGSKSGILFKFTARQLGELPGNPGPTLADDFGFDDVAADLMCETLFFGVVGDSDDYRRFKKAYNEAGSFASIPQGTVSGSGILAVEVLRHCPGDVTPGVEVSSRYNGIAGSHLGAYDPIFGGFGYYVPLIYAEKAGLNTVMYIQNGGLECSSVEIWFKAQDDCLRARICEIFTLAPGESYQWDASDCVGPDWQGSAWLRSSQVMGIAVDIFGRDILMTYTGEPQPFAYVITNEDGEPEEIVSVTTGELVAYGPLMFSEYQGWDTGVQVMNLSEVYNAKVKVYFLDRSGDVITTLVDWICPRGSQTFFLPVVADLPGSWVGSIRVESQDWWTPGTNPIHAPSIVGVATLMKYSDAARTETQEAIAYNLLPEHKSYIWQVGSGPGGTISGVGLIAIPSLLKDLDGTGTTSEVAIMNLTAKPGFTDFAVYIYDQNGLLDFICEKLHSRQVEYIDLQTWGYVNNGFKGSAIISATFWEHDVFTPTGQFVRNLLGLGAVGIERTGTRLGEDVPGDEAAGSRGIPFQTDRNIELCLGGFTPRCPGQPSWDPQP